MKPCIVFDFDGTIAYSPRKYIEIFNQMAHKFKCRKVGEDGMDVLRTLSPKETLRYLGVSWLKTPMVVKAMKREIGKRLDEFPMVEGIMEVVEALREKGYRLGIISTNAERNVLKYLKINDIRGFSFFSCDTSLFHKHRSIRAFLRRYGIRKEDMLYIGDEVRDVWSSKKAGVAVVAVNWGYHSGERLRSEEPDFFVTKPAELLGVVEEFARPFSSKQGPKIPYKAQGR